MVKFLSIHEGSLRIKELLIGKRPRE